LLKETNSGQQADILAAGSAELKACIDFLQTLLVAIHSESEPCHGTSTFDVVFPFSIFAVC